jgi:hypothetical protein
LLSELLDLKLQQVHRHLDGPWKHLEGCWCVVGPRVNGPQSQFEQSLALTCRGRLKLIRRALMKVLGATVIVLVVLYFADQQFAQGHYTDAVQQMCAQMMHSLGTS